MRILLADHHQQVRSALGWLLEHEPDMRVVGEASAAEELLSRLSVTQPEVILLETELPGSSTTKILAGLRAFNTQIKVIALNVRFEAQQAALTAGADAFISKSDPAEHLLPLLRSILQKAKLPL